jgi:uncharacterized membrane protein YfcA
VKDAVHATVAAYIVTGLVQTSLWAYQGSLEGRDAAVMCLATMPTAVLAGFVLPGAPSPLLTLLTALLAFASGVSSLVNIWRQAKGGDAVAAAVCTHGGTRQHERPSTADELRVRLQLTGGELAHTGERGARSVQMTCYFRVGLGAFTGFCSAVTGTGGPFLLLPVLLFCRPELPALRAVGIAQAVPLPIAVAATLANGYFAQVDVCVAAELAACIAPGLPVGVQIAHRLGKRRLRVAVSALLVAVGLASMVHLAQHYWPQRNQPKMGSGSWEAAGIL